MVTNTMGEGVVSDVITDVQSLINKSKEELNLNLALHKEGKVRSVFEILHHIVNNGDNNQYYGKEKLLMIASDRVSAFDFVFNEGIPYKGVVLTQVSSFWFKKTKDIVGNHCITADKNEIEKILEEEHYFFEGYNLPDWTKGRTMLVRKAKAIPVEAIVRGYLLGSAWKSYVKTGKIGKGGIELEDGLKLGDKLPEPVFTPTTKAESGHDVEITEDEMKHKFGDKITNRIKEIAVKLYKYGEKYASSKGLILADTKFEFGLVDTYNVTESISNDMHMPSDKLILIDEAMTPDSSRYLDKQAYDEGKIKYFDKQYLRDYLESIKWDKTPPVPKIPNNVVIETSHRYVELYERITGNKIESILG